MQRQSKWCRICSNHKRLREASDLVRTACVVTLNKARGHSKNREIGVDVDYIKNLLEAQNQKCAYTGIPMELPDHKGCKDKRMCASLDRIDSTKGYIEGNVQ